MKARYTYIAALAVIIIDQFTKHLVQSRLPYGSSTQLVGPVDITLVRNPGGAFGIFQSGTVPLTIISMVVVLGILIISRKSGPMGALIGTALALQLGGAVGNLIDRLRFGHVVDFIDLQVWPVFNVADMAITSGIVLLTVYLISHDRSARRPVSDAARAESDTAER